MEIFLLFIHKEIFLNKPILAQNISFYSLELIGSLLILLKGALFPPCYTIDTV